MDSADTAIPFTIADVDRLAELEATVQRGIRAFIEVGEALIEIRDSRLYRAQYPTFEAYCRERWQMVASRARQYISAVEVIHNLEGVTNVTLPANESQARELMGLAPVEQQLVWYIVVSTAPGGVVTAGHVRSVVDILKELMPTGALDDGEGNSIPVSAATFDHLKAAVTEETYERMRRQQQHIADNSRKTRLITRAAWHNSTEFENAQRWLFIRLAENRENHIEIIIREILD